MRTLYSETSPRPNGFGPAIRKSTSIVGVLMMSTAKSLLASIGAASLLSFTVPALAGPSQALAGCKAQIASDARLSHFESVYQNTEEIKRRGRFTSFEIKVRGKTASGAEAAWTANCKARGSGQVETLDLVQVSGNSETRVAQTDN